MIAVLKMPDIGDHTTHPTLHTFDIIYRRLSVRTPDDTTVVKKRTNEGFIKLYYGKSVLIFEYFINNA